MVDVQVVSDYHWIFWDAQHGLAWLWSRDVPDVRDPFPTPVEIKPGLTGYSALSMAAVSHDRAIGVLASAGYGDMLEDEDGGPLHPEVPVQGGDIWIFVNDDLMPTEMDGIDEESARLWNEAEAGLSEAVCNEGTRPKLCGH